LTAKKQWINIILPVVGIIIVLLYMICEGSCAYLEGSLIGLPLNYLGIIYMGILLVSNLFKKLEVSLFLLSSGLGAEVQLLGFQIQNDVFCSYCLSFGAVILLLFLLNFEKSKKIFISGSLVLGLILFSIFFKGSATPAYAEDIVIPSFGCGKIQVRLYTDYFCNPCRALEPKIEPLIIDLVEKEVITITFIDTPIHPQTTLYVKYFLYILHENRKFKHALHARNVLFEAAKEKIKDSEKLEAFIKKKGIPFKPFDPSATFKIFSESIRKDKIKATPTCVIYKDGKGETFDGRDIKGALEKLQ
jgi:thiol-disulfide isomerase/thioredoxin